MQHLREILRQNLALGIGQASLQWVAHRFLLSKRLFQLSEHRLLEEAHHFQWVAHRFLLSERRLLEEEHHFQWVAHRFLLSRRLLQLSERRLL